MKCIICDSAAKSYFTTDFSVHFGGRFRDQLNKSEYYKCSNCGFTFSKNVYEMDYNSWCELNLKAHSEFESQNVKSRLTNQPPYLAQAAMINMLIEDRIIGGGSSDILDYAGGIGSLARILSRYYHREILVYEDYMNEFNNDGCVKYINKDQLQRYDVVINSAMFEHITKREHLEHINSLVRDDGVLIIHTLIRENIPKNPNWFYIAPVHCSFHTNKSMQILMDNWGYTHSIYSPISKCWVLFKKDNENCDKLEQYVESINNLLQEEYLFYKVGFVDYWLD